MLIDLWRKVVATEYAHTCCGVCGNDFDRGSVFTDDGYQLGEMCTPCLDYLNRRKADADDPTLGNWPARGWPALEDLEEMRRRYPGAMYSDDDALAAAFTSWAEEDEIYRKSFIWRMEREQRIGK